jgi:hypothetical protein
MKTLAILLFVLTSLSVNAGWFGKDEPISTKDSIHIQTDVDITGAFGLNLGSTYDQDFIKAANPIQAYNSNDKIIRITRYGSLADTSVGSLVKPARPIDSLYRYKLFVDDSKVAYMISGYGEFGFNCVDDLDYLLIAMMKKYNFSGTNGYKRFQSITNSDQSREIRYWCPPNSDGVNAGLRVDYIDHTILNKYKDRLPRRSKEKLDTRININSDDI